MYSWLTATQYVAGKNRAASWTPYLYDCDHHDIPMFRVLAVPWSGLVSSLKRLEKIAAGPSSSSFTFPPSLATPKILNRKLRKAAVRRYDRQPTINTIITLSSAAD